MKITVTGIPRARATLEKVLTLDVALRKTLTALVSERLRGEAYRRTPVRTGRLRASGRVTVTGDTISYFNPRPYSWFVELGTGERGSRTWKNFFNWKSYKEYVREYYVPSFTRNWPGMEAQPYGRPAIATAMDDLREILHRTVEEELR